MTARKNGDPIRLVHFSFGFFDDEIPPKVQARIDTVARENPRWKTEVWGPEESRELIRTRYPAFLPIYDSYTYPIQRSDASRYFILHTFGGLYMDVDYDLMQPLETVLADMEDRAPGATVHLNETPNSLIGHRSLSNSFMYARRALDPFWSTVHAALVLSATKMTFSRYLHVMFSTGPNFLTNAFLEYSTATTTKGGPASGAADRGRVVILPKEIYNPCSICCHPDVCASKRHLGGAMAFHENAGSWSNTAMENTGRFFYCWAKVLLPALLVILGVLVAGIVKSTSAGIAGRPPVFKGSAPRPLPRPGFARGFAD